jgi:catechol 2,3-dioxygenase-like lactoylglutathione lyase family enzyme
VILKTRHTGLVVQDIKRSIAFYEALGLTVWRREIEQGPFISQVVGIDSAVIETAKLKLSDGSLVELLQYHSHPDHVEIQDSASNKHGCSHIAFTVESAQGACDLLLQLGGSIVNAPAMAPNGMVNVAYGHDVDGILLELVEELG